MASPDEPPLETSSIARPAAIAIKLLRRMVSVGIILALGYYLYAHWEDFQSSASISASHIVILVVCILATWIVNCLQVVKLLEAQGTPVGFWENLVVQTAVILANYLPLRAGTILRFRYFKRFHGVGYLQLGGIMGVRTLVLLFATGVTGCVGTLGLAVGPGETEPMLLLIFLGLLIAPLAVYIPTFSRLVASLRARWNTVGKLLDGYVALRERPEVALQVFLLVLVQFSILAVRLYVCFDALGLVLSPWALLVMAPAATLLSFVTITPGNLGLREWVIGAISVVAGYELSGAMFAGSLDRIVLMGCTFVLGGLAMARLWRSTRGELL